MFRLQRLQSTFKKARLKFPINRQGYPNKIDIFSKNQLQAMGKIVNPLFLSC